MSLVVKKSFKKYIPKIIFGIIAILCIGFVARVWFWEKNYYEEKEGSERAVAVIGDIETPAEDDDDDDTVSDEVVTEKQQNEYRVAPEKPRYLYIDKLGIKKARIFEVGVNSKGQLKTPNTNYDAAWYKDSDLPGTGGTALLDGHNGGPSSYGIFKKLNTLKPGDIIRIEMGDGTVYSYRVYDNFEVKLKDANEKMQLLMTSPVDGVESISIISCIGEYSLQQKTYLSRQFLRATRIE
jgi:sortase (surface protein transpeptidase)